MAYYENATISLFDIRLNKVEQINISNIVEERHRDAIKELEQKAGIVIKIENISNGETFAQSFFDRMNYSTIRCEPRSYIGHGEHNSGILEYLKKYTIFDSSETWDRLIYRPGVPDYIVYKKDSNDNIIELFFCEVKSINDGIKYSQLSWYFSNNAPIKILYGTNW